MVKHNEDKTITLMAFDKDSNVVDKEVVQTKRNAEVVYFEFEHTARDLYRAVRITMDVAWILLVIFFLSSAFARPAEAHYGLVTGSITVDSGVLERRHYWAGSNLDKFSLLTGVPLMGAFERQNPPVEYIIVWPKMPSVSEQMVRIANDHLRLFLAEEKRKKDDYQLSLNPKFHWYTLGELLMCLGLILFTVGYGKWRDLRRKPFDLSDSA